MNRPRKKDRHLPACLYFKNSSYWFVKRGKWTNLGKSLQVALSRYARDYARAGGGGLDSLIDRAFDSLASRKAEPLSKNTLSQYRIAARKLKKLLRDFDDPKDVTGRDIVDIRRGMRDTPNMANRVLSFTRQVFDFALEDGLIDSNPAVGVKRLGEKHRDRLPAIEELERIYAKAGPRLQVIMDLLLRAGQRVRDTLNIKRSDITDEGIRFTQQKTGKKLLVKWTPELREVVDRARALYGNIVALTLLHNRRGKAPDYSTVKIQWSAACKAAGVADVQLRDLRAVAATWAKRQGKNATLLLGHSSANTTRIYLRDRDFEPVDGPDFGQLLDNRTK